MSDKASFGKVSFVSDLIRFPNINSQEPGRAAAAAKNGVFVGFMRGLPYFLDFTDAINPHVFVCGITGSGKTYLMKSLMLKLAKMVHSVIVLIDFTGEYESFVNLAGEIQVGAEHFAEFVAKKTAGILYLNLKYSGNNTTRVRIADSVLNQIIEDMRKREGKGRVFVMLDEAWKLLGGSRALHTLLREGRKYGYGLVFSSQLVEDMDLAMLSNAATLFIFRLQNKQGLSRLAGNYGWRGEQIDLIQKLGVGSCVVMQTLASGRREFCLIERVHGIRIEETIVFETGDKIRLEINKGKFEDTMRNVCGTDKISEALRVSERNGYIELSTMIAFLLDSGTQGRKLLNALRKLGIGEDALADAFAVAVSSRGKQ